MYILNALAAAVFTTSSYPVTTSDYCLMQEYVEVSPAESATWTDQHWEYVMKQNSDLERTCPKKKRRAVSLGTPWMLTVGERVSDDPDDILYTYHDYQTEEQCEGAANRLNNGNYDYWHTIVDSDRWYASCSKI